jgi:predicted ribosomally synthesized peptide with SipW-like signal peptide
MNKSRILLGLVLILGAGGALATGTSAYFSDTETSSGNTFTAGAIDLQVDNTSYYNGVLNQGTTWTVTNLTIEKFFDFNDVKPDDYGEDTISLHVDTNDAYMCANVSLTSNDDNSINEPEGEDGDVTDGAGAGELADLMEFIWWADDGDNVLEDNEDVISQGPIGALDLDATTTVTLADSTTNIWTGAPGPVDGETTYYIGKAWCFGDIGAAPVTQDGQTNVMSPAGNNAGTAAAGEPEDGGISCDGSALDNQSQTDSLTADVEFTAVQSRNNPGFQCVPPPTTQACEPGQQYADAAGLFSQGRTKAGGVIAANRSQPSAAFGAPQTAGADSDVGFPAGSFVSLGLGVATTATRSLVLDFSDNWVVDEPGMDLKIYEVTGGVYPDEHVTVEASQNGTTWVVIDPDAIRDEEIDLAGSGLAWARYIRITDTNSAAAFSDSVADGYDLDAVEALHCAVPLTLIDGPNLQ